MKRRLSLAVLCVMLLSACGGKKAQVENADTVADSTIVAAKGDKGVDTEVLKQEKEAVRSYVEQFYSDWSDKELTDYDNLKQHITPNLQKFLADAYEFDCEGECLAVWKFFYEGGGDVGEIKSRQITARDARHVLVENKYENYEYDVLLTVVRDADTFRIDSLKQERSEYID